MSQRRLTMAAVAMIAGLALGGVAIAGGGGLSGGGGTAPHGPSNACPPPHKKCKVVNGQQVCTTQTAPNCTGGG